MTTGAVAHSPPIEGALPRLVRAGLLTGLVDGLWAIVLTLAYGRSLVRLWQGIAATPFGARMFDGGAATVALGVAMHVGVAFAWSAVLLMLLTRSRGLRAVLASPLGALKVAAVYGPLVWVVMSALVIPTFTHTPLAVTYRWWIQLVGHIAFVGFPMAWALREPVAGVHPASR